MASFHFVDPASGYCVQMLNVERADMTDAEIEAELQLSAIAAARTLVSLAKTPGHVCKVPPPALP